MSANMFLYLDMFFKFQYLVRYIDFNLSHTLTFKKTNWYYYLKKFTFAVKQ